MSVTQDAVGPAGGAGATSSTTTLVFAHICAVDATVLYAAVAVGVPGSDASIVTTADYNGVAMTSIGKIHSNNMSAGYLEVFKLEAPSLPTDGLTHNITITRANGTGTITLSGGSVSYKGSGSSAHVATNAGSAATVTTGPITSATGNMVAAFFVAGNSFGTITGGTRRVIKNTNQSSAGGNFQCGDAAGAATVTITTTDSNDWWGALGVDIVAGGAPPPANADNFFAVL